MCPACMASAVTMAGGVITTGGLTALVGKVLHTRKAKTTGSDNSTERRNDHGYGNEQDGTFDGRASS
jgi:hypothetical protein